MNSISDFDSRPYDLAIVLVTRNRRELLDRAILTMRASVTQSGFRCQWIIVQNGADPESLQVIQNQFRNHSHIFLRLEEPILPAEARNRAIAKVNAPWIYFADDDVDVPINFFKIFKESYLNNGSADVVGGPNLTPAASSRFQAVSGALLASKLASYRCSNRYRLSATAERIENCDDSDLILCNLFVKTVFAKEYPFPATYLCAEENFALEKWKSAGAKLVLDSNLFVFHERRSTLGSFCQQIFKYGRGRGRLVSVGSFKFFHIAPTLCLLFTLAAAIFPGLRLTFLTLLVAYCSLILVLGLQIARSHKSLADGILAAVLTVAVHVCFGFGVFMGSTWDTTRASIRSLKSNFPQLRRASLGLVVISFLFGLGTLARNYPSSFRHRSKATLDSASKTRLFKDVTATTGISSHYVRPTLDPFIQPRVDSFFVAPGFAILDVNNDHLPDIFIPATKPEAKNQLYINHGSFRFVEAAVEWKVDQNKSGLLAADSATTVDLNGDGLMDVLLTGAGCTHAYLNQKDRFEDISAASGLGDCKNAIAAIPFDIDGDGKMDIFMVRYWADQNLFNLKDPYVYVNNLFNATNGGQNSILMNEGNSHFRDETSTRGTTETHWSYDAAFADYFDDGTFGLYVANDYGPDDFYRIKDGKLELDPHIFSTPDRRQGMNVSLGDLTSDGVPSVYISNAFEGPPFGLSGNFLWRFQNREATDSSFPTGVADCDFAWGGAFGDFDHNGFVDLYVANGFISSEIPPDQKISRMGRAQTQLYGFSTVRTLPGELSSDIRNWTRLDEINWPLHYRQRDCLFMNSGSKTNDVSDLMDVALEQGIDDDLLDNRAVTAVDFDNDGDLDLAISSRNGPFKILENQTNPDAERWIGFNLGSTPAAFGAKIELERDGHRQYRWSTGGRNGFLASSDPRIHFGLKTKGSITAKIRWRTGKITKLRDLQPGTYYDVQPN